MNIAIRLIPRSIRLGGRFGCRFGDRSASTRAPGHDGDEHAKGQRHHKPLSPHPPHNKHAPREHIVGPGRLPDSIGTPYEMAAGLERIEYLSKMAGRSVYLDAPLKVDHYGTPADPILVESLDDERIVGCTGFPKYSHFPMWLRVKGKMRCVECGQAFQIKTIE